MRVICTGISGTGRLEWLRHVVSLARSRGLDVKLYDVDASLLKSIVLSAGWLLVTFRGGHGFSAVETPTTVIECKLGPYIGRDYEFI